MQFLINNILAIYSLILVLLVPASFAAQINPNDYPVANVSVSQYSTESFTLQFVINNNKILRHNWALGFFMFHILAKQKNQISIVICNNDLAIKNQMCSAMKVLDTLPDFVGHVNLIAPAENFILQKQHSYVITINGLSNIPRNATAMPQQLFFYDIKNKEITDIEVASSINRTYNSSLAVAKLESIIEANWGKIVHTTPEPLNLVGSISPILPTPRLVTYGRGTNLGNQVSLVTLCKNYTYINISRTEQKNGRGYKQLYNCSQIKDQPEGYVLSFESKQVMIYANTIAGIFYAKQTVKQLKYYFGSHIPQQSIIDYPRFRYRGLMLDTVRHFFAVKEIKKILDVMAQNKLNTLHLHLSDDEGWRLELPHFAKLSQIGGNRGGGSIIPAANLINKKSDITNVNNKNYETITNSYSGYYTVRDVKSLIRYANKRQITIIPELEMPGHALAMKLSLPDIFFESGATLKYMSIQGYTNNVLPICKYGTESVFTTSINDIIKNVATLFNQQTTVYAIHNEISLSGDEVPQSAYTCSPNATEDISHRYFAAISSNMPGYAISGWQQLIQNDDGGISESLVIAPSKVGHVWAWQPTAQLPVSGLIMANNLLKHNYPVVINFADFAYFDLRYAPLFDEPGLYWAKDYSDTFNIFSLGAVLNNLESGNLVGVEGSLWSELVPSSEHLWYMLLPKMIALADVAWADPFQTSWHNFVYRLGCGDNGFLAYLHNNYHIIYRGYPYGISKEVPPSICVRHGV